MVASIGIVCHTSRPSDAGTDTNQQGSLDRDVLYMWAVTSDGSSAPFFCQ
jgi:hypothetical protein